MKVFIVKKIIPLFLLLCCCVLVTSSKQFLSVKEKSCPLCDLLDSLMIPQNVNFSSEYYVYIATPYPLFINDFLDSVQARDARVALVGYNIFKDNIIVKMYVEDIKRRQLYLLLMNKENELLDYICSDNPYENGDQLAYEADTSIEWHFYSDMYLIDSMVVKKNISVDIKSYESLVDTIFYEKTIIQYSIINNSFFVTNTDTISVGRPF